MKKHILIVDDEVAIRAMLRMALETEHFQVSEASSAHHAEKILETASIDLILLDWMMPGVSGIDFATKLRRRSDADTIGIIMLTAKDAEEDLIRGLEVGADDYVSKPFSTRELLSRISAVIRRLQATASSDESITVGRITITPEQYRIEIDQHEVNCSPTEFRLLYFLLTHLNRVFTREQLLDNVWGEQVYVEDRTVDVHVRRLRKVLEEYECDSYIKTVRGAGYCSSIPSADK